MELYLVDSDCDKVTKMRSCWYNVVVLVGLLSALNLAAFLSELSQDSVRRSANEGLITLGVKFLNLCIAKAAQFRYADPLQAQPSLMPLVFWFALARSAEPTSVVNNSQDSQTIATHEQFGSYPVFSTFKNTRLEEAFLKM